MELQIFSILIVCMYRCFYVGVTATFINYAFPVEHFGKLYGITRVIAGLTVLLSTVIFNAVLKSGNKFKNANFDFAIVIGKFFKMLNL